jgi:hypothetical protein
MDHGRSGMPERASSLQLGLVNSISPGQRRILRRLTLTSILVVVLASFKDSTPPWSWPSPWQ